MNDVPAIFFEGVVSRFFFKKELSCGSALAGLPGLVASEFYEKRCRHVMVLNNGQLTKESYWNCKNEPIYIEMPRRKYVHYTEIAIRADKEEYDIDPEASLRLLSATAGKPVLLSFETSNISVEIAKSVDSVRFVFELQVHTKITSDVLKVMRSCVEKNTVNKMLIGEDVEIEDGATKVLVDLLKQKQFHEMFLRGKCSAALQEIIANWRENSEEMVGNMIYCTNGFSDLQLSSTEFPFEEGTEDEERAAERAYYLSGHWPNITAISVLRNEDGRVVYCLSLPHCFTYKSVFLFA